MKTFKDIWVYWVLLAVLGMCAIVHGESAARVPTRIPPLPAGLAEPALPSKKARQAAELRRTAEKMAATMEEEARRDIEAFGAVNSNRMAKFDFSTDKFAASVDSVSFMEVGTNIVMQVRLNCQEK